MYMLIECEILFLCDSARFTSVKLITKSSLLSYLNPFLINNYIFWGIINNYIKNDIYFEIIPSKKNLFWDYFFVMWPSLYLS